MGLVPNLRSKASLIYVGKYRIKALSVHHSNSCKRNQVINRPMKQQDWDRVLFYAKRIKHICYATVPAVDSLSLTRLAQAITTFCPDATLLPNLKDFKVDVWTFKPSSLDLVTAMIGHSYPQTLSLTINAGSPTHPGWNRGGTPLVVQNRLAPMFERSFPSVRNLRLVVPPTVGNPGLLGTLRDVVPSFIHLTDVAFGGIIPDLGLILQLGKLPTLKYLTFFDGDLEGIRRIGSKTGQMEPLFPSLLSVYGPISTTRSILRFAPLDRLTTVRVQIQGDYVGLALRDLISEVVGRAGSVSSVEVQLDAASFMTTRDPDLLHPLAVCKKMEWFTVKGFLPPSNSDLRRLCRSWPNLKCLTWDAYRMDAIQSLNRPLGTLDALTLISKICPALHTLDVPVDARAGPADDTPVHLDPPTSLNVRQWLVAQGEEGALAEYLVKLVNVSQLKGWRRLPVGERRRFWEQVVVLVGGGSTSGRLL